MRATEALHLSHPDTKLDKEALDNLMFIDYDKDKKEIHRARRYNRKSLKGLV